MDLSAVLEETLRKYSNCLTYSDKGYLVKNNDNSAPPAIQFSTHFKRPKAIRFEWSGETNITRQGFVPDASKSTMLCCSPEGNYIYFDPRNTEESTLCFVSAADMLREDSMLSGYVTDVIPPLLSREFGTTPMLGKKACRQIQKLDDQEDYAFCAQRSYKQYFSKGPASITDTIWIDEKFQIRRFRRLGTTRASDKRDSKTMKKIRRGTGLTFDRAAAKDDISIYDYHFSEVFFDKDLDDVLFCMQ